MDLDPHDEKLLDLYNRIEYFLKDYLVHLDVVDRAEFPDESMVVVADRYFAASKFKTIGESWNHFELGQGLETLRFALECSLFFQEDFMDQAHSEILANEFLNLVGKPIGFLSTGQVNFDLRELKESPVFLPPPFHEDYNLGLIAYSETKMAVLAVRYPVIY